MSVPPRWACLDGIFVPALTIVRFVATTDAACHLWARWTEVEPQFHPKTLVIRGQPTLWDLRICFVAYQDLEQDEPGNTVTHTFTWNPWLVCVTRWFYLYGTVAGVKSPSTSGLFVYHNQYVPPPPEEEIMALATIPALLASQKVASNLTSSVTKKSVS